MKNTLLLQHKILFWIIILLINSILYIVFNIDPLDNIWSVLAGFILSDLYDGVFYNRTLKDKYK